MDSRFSAFELDSCNARSGAAAGISALPRRGTARPVVAIFGEWNTANLGDRAIHHEVLRFSPSAAGIRVPLDWGRLRG